MKAIKVRLAIAALLGLATTAQVNAQATEPFIGQIAWVPYNFAPRGWAFCDGQLLPINQNQALFSLLGTTYGGNGQTTFALPDMRGRVMVSRGQGPGLSNVDLGQTGGAETVTLTQSQLPAHSHSLVAANSAGNVAAPAGAALAMPALPLAQSPTAKAYSTAAPGTPLNPATVGATGGSQPFTNVQPFLGLQCIIALQGIFPSRI